jgi:hypothetical protein
MNQEHGIRNPGYIKNNIREKTSGMKDFSKKDIKPLKYQKLKKPCYGKFENKIYGIGIEKSHNYRCMQFSNKY